MTEDPERERIARMLAELDELSPADREAALTRLSEDDREAVRAAELEESELAIPDEDEEPGAGD
jgi:hypothetical protein